MIKRSRKISDDPDKELLLDNKTNWNIKITKFIATLIAIKRAINGQPVTALSIQKSSIKEPLPDKIPELLNYLSAQYEEATREALDIVDQQRDYAEKKLNKNASNMLSRLLYYAKTPFDFKNQDRWDKKNILQATAKLFSLIEDIQENILTRKDSSIPDAVFSSKIFIHNFLNDLARPLFKMYQNENEHLFSIIKEINKEIELIEQFLKTVVVSDDNMETVSSLKQLIGKYKIELSNYKLVEAINTFEEIKELVTMFSKNANEMNIWFLKKYLRLFNKEDAPVRLACSDIADKISGNLDKLMNSVQSGEDLVSLSAHLHDIIENLLEFIDLLEQLSDMHNSFMNLQKNEGGKSKAMLVPARDVYFLRNIKKELKDSLVKFKNISGS